MKREIKMDDIGADLRDFLTEEDPLEADIGIFDGSGDLAGVMISPEAYEFFLKKIEEEEDRIDTESVKSGGSIFYGIGE